MFLILKRRFTNNEAAQTIFVFLLAGFVILTLAGLLRGTDMTLPGL